MARLVVLLVHGFMRKNWWVHSGLGEFSRKGHFAILADASNLSRLRRALADLQAKVIGGDKSGDFRLASHVCF
jgi:hypothetical protein